MDSLMPRTHLRIVLLILSLVLTSACTKEKELTESQIRFDNALLEQSELVVKAENYLDNQLTGELTHDLSSLIYALELVYYAEQVFVDAKIIGVMPNNLTKLKVRLNAYEAPVKQRALTLLQLAYDETMSFQTRVHEMPLAPVSGASLGSNSMIKFLGEEYNKKLDKCCLVELKKLEILLRNFEDEVTLSIRKRIINVEKELSMVLSNEEYQINYQHSIEVIKDTLSVSIDETL
jgi:hypothetical protein